VVWIVACPSQSAMLAVSIPACRRLIAQVCRSVCGATFFSFSEGHCSAAFATCRATSLPTVALVSAVPVLVGNSGPSGVGGSSPIQAVRSLALALQGETASVLERALCRQVAQRAVCEGLCSKL
jgi:hypothetical protein